MIAPMKLSALLFALSSYISQINAIHGTPAFYQRNSGIAASHFHLNPAHIPILVLSSRNPAVLWAPNSHLACHDYLVRLARDNYFQCPGTPATDPGHKVVLSRFAEPCKGAHAKLCDAQFECVMIDSFRGCPKQFWQTGMDGIWTFFCKQSGQVTTYPLIKKPRVGSKSHVVCMERNALDNLSFGKGKSGFENASTWQKANRGLIVSGVTDRSLLREQLTREIRATVAKEGGDLEDLISWMVSEAIELGDEVTCEDVTLAGGTLQ